MKVWYVMYASSFTSESYVHLFDSEEKAKKDFDYLFGLHMEAVKEHGNEDMLNDSTYYSEDSDPNYKSVWFSSDICDSEADVNITMCCGGVD